MVKIYPSLMAAEQKTLHDEIQTLEPYCDGFHLDVMDGFFAPNLGFNFEMLNKIDHTTTLPSFIHLMVDDPQRWVMDHLMLKLGTPIAFHKESSTQPSALIGLIRQHHWSPGIALKPSTPIKTVYPYLSDIDHVLLLAVEPGPAGQIFNPEVLDKVDALVRYRQLYNLSFSIGLDGGISLENIGLLTQKGVDFFCIGSAIFDSQDPVQRLKQLYAKARSNH
jgi:ribulose-phosphate 3-epimerase